MLALSSVMLSVAVLSIIMLCDTVLRVIFVVTATSPYQNILHEVNVMLCCNFAVELCRNAECRYTEVVMLSR